MRKLSDNQKKAIFPGPGNPGFADGSVPTMRALFRMGLIDLSSSLNNRLGFPLTEKGQIIRRRLEREAADQTPAASNRTIDRATHA